MFAVLFFLRKTICFFIIIQNSSPEYFFYKYFIFIVPQILYLYILLSGHFQRFVLLFFAHFYSKDFSRLFWISLLYNLLYNRKRFRKLFFSFVHHLSFPRLKTVFSIEIPMFSLDCRFKKFLLKFDDNLIKKS